MIISIQDWNPAGQTLRSTSLSQLPYAHCMKGSALSWTSSGFAGDCLDHNCTGRDCYVLPFWDRHCGSTPMALLDITPLVVLWTNAVANFCSASQAFLWNPREPPQFVHFVCPQNHVDTEVCSLQKLIWACLREQLARKLSSGGSPRQCVCGKNPSVLEPKMGF